MMAGADRKSRRIDRDIALLGEFIGAYCRKEHGSPRELCDSCRELFEYAADRRRRCPLDPKPACRSCRVHCYGEPYRTRIRQAMRTGAIFCITHGRAGTLLGHALGSWKDKLWKSKETSIRKGISK